VGGGTLPPDLSETAGAALGSALCKRAVRGRFKPKRACIDGSTGFHGRQGMPRLVMRLELPGQASRIAGALCPVVLVETGRTAMVRSDQLERK